MEKIRGAKEQLASMQIREFIRRMKRLGLTQEEIMNLFQQIIGEEVL